MAQQDVVRVSDSQVTTLPQVSQGSQTLVFPPYSQQSINKLQSMVQSRTVINTQTNHQFQHELPDPLAAHQHQQMEPVPSFQDVFMQTGATAQSSGDINFSHGFGRGSVPLVQSHAPGTVPDHGGEYKGYSNLRQNAQRVPHPDDGHWGRGSRGRRGFHFWNNIRAQRMQGYATQNLGFRQVSAENEYRNDNNEQNILQDVFSDTSVTTHFNPGTWAEIHQQQPVVHDNTVRTNQQQIFAVPVSVVGTDTRRAFEDSLVKATLALQLENAETSGPRTDDITPRRPIANNTVSATAPPKLGHQTPFLRSRRGQSVVGLNGSPVRRTSQPLTIDPVRGLPPAFYPQDTPAVVTTSTVSSPVLSVSNVQHQTSASQSRATSVSVHSEEPHTAQGITFGGHHLVTPNSQQAVTKQVVGFTLPPPQTASHQMAQNQMTPWQITPYQMPLVAAGPVSRHLSIIAPGGRKPTIEVACDPQNLPFVELLRRAQPSNSNGVVRISNVSTPLR